MMLRMKNSSIEMSSDHSPVIFLLDELGILVNAL